MSKYTTEVRYICEMESNSSDSVAKNIDEIIEKSLTKIFNFNYPIFDENYRSVLERKILKHYYTREIGEETYGLWKLRLNTKLNEIMPYYNKLYESELLSFNPLYTVDLSTTRNVKNETDKTENETITDTNTNTSTIHSTSTGTSTNNGTGWNLFNDTPQGGIQNIENESYLTNATKNTNSDTTTNSDEGNSSKNDSGNFDRTRGVNDKIDSTETYLESVAGFTGTSGSKLLKEYRETFLNIDMQVINELDVLFLQLW